jgi:hypothetical protein
MKMEVCKMFWVWRNYRRLLIDIMSANLIRSKGSVRCVCKLWCLALIVVLTCDK